MEKTMPDVLLFDDFFVDARDPGESRKLTLKDRNGNEREVEVRMKRALTLGDREAAKAAGTKTRVKPNGQLEVVGFDDGEFTIDLLSRTIIAWPFKRVERDEDGNIVREFPVAITKDNLRAMRHDNADEFAKLVQELIAGSPREDLDFFEKPSDAAS
jgi:hypothetical protein